MEKNIFENAYFGKPYKTRGEKKAIYIHHYKDSEGGDMHYLIIDGSAVTYVWGADGKIAPSYNNDELDIVSEWKEPINEDELEMLAFNNYCKDCHYCESANAKTLEEKYEACQKSECYRKTYVWKLINGYKAGYRNAKEGK